MPQKQSSQPGHTTLEELNQQITDLSENLAIQMDFQEQQNAEFIQRITKLEQMVENGSINGDQSKADADVCPLERYSNMSVIDRGDNLTKSVRRAVIVWENYDEWSSPAFKGRVIDSSQLRKLLNTSTQSELAFSQIYRVMKAFDKHTSEKYKYIDNKNTGKVLIKYGK